MGNRLNVKESQKLIRGFSIPTRPNVMLEISKTQNNFVQNMVEVTAILLRDMALAAHILRAANTQLTGYNRRVESIECAMVLLGQEKLREIAHELFLSATITRKESWMQKMRTQSVRSAQILSWLSQSLPLISPHFDNGNLPLVPYDEAYVTGLFHDCGKLVLLQRFVDYPNLLTADRNSSHQTLESEEAERYQTTHALLGSLLCNTWQLPKPLVHVIEAHHHLDAFAGRPVKERKYMVLHAMVVMTEWIEGDLLEWEWARHRDYVQRLFALDGEQLIQLRQRAQETIPVVSLRGA